MKQYMAIGEKAYFDKVRYKCCHIGGLKDIERCKLCMLPREVCSIPGFIRCTADLRPDRRNVFFLTVEAAGEARLKRQQNQKRKLCRRKSSKKSKSSIVAKGKDTTVSNATT